MKNNYLILGFDPAEDYNYVNSVIWTNAINRELNINSSIYDLPDHIYYKQYESCRAAAARGSFFTFLGFNYYNKDLDESLLERYGVKYEKSEIYEDEVDDKL